MIEYAGLRKTGEQTEDYLNTASATIITVIKLLEAGVVLYLLLQAVLYLAASWSSLLQGSMTVGMLLKGILNTITGQYAYLKRMLPDLEFTDPILLVYLSIVLLVSLVTMGITMMEAVALTVLRFGRKGARLIRNFHGVCAVAAIVRMVLLAAGVTLMLLTAVVPGEIRVTSVTGETEELPGEIGAAGEAGASSGITGVAVAGYSIETGGKAALEELSQEDAASSETGRKKDRNDKADRDALAAAWEEYGIIYTISAVLLFLLLLMIFFYHNDIRIAMDTVDYEMRSGAIGPFRLTHLAVLSILFALPFLTAVVLQLLPLFNGTVAFMEYLQPWNLSGITGTLFSLICMVKHLAVAQSYQNLKLAR